MSFISNIFLKRLFLPKTLLARFMLIIIVPTIIGQLIAIQVFYQRHWYNVIQHTSSMIVKEVVNLIENQSYKHHPFEKQIYNNLIFYYIPSSFIPEKNKSYIEEFDIFEQNLRPYLSYPLTMLLDKENKIEIFLQINQDVLKIKIPSKLLINPTTYIFVLWIVLLTILLLTTSLIFSKNQIKSILDLSRAANCYGRGQKIDDYRPSGAMEVRQAGLAFLKMQKRIERQKLKRTQMLAMISHDLKTPLTRMKLQIELMENSEEKEELKYDIESMQYMISSYLDFSRGEGGENFIYEDLNSWISEYVKIAWANNPITLKTQKQKAFIQIKPHSFKRAVDNLISNSLKYSTKLKISVYSRQDSVYLIIEDNGIGIRDAEKLMVFKPFYRGDKSRSLDSSTNVGLGLAITKEIINGHYGTIKLEDSVELKGLLVKIKLPKIKLNDKP